MTKNIPKKNNTSQDHIKKHATGVMRKQKFLNILLILVLIGLISITLLLLYTKGDGLTTKDNILTNNFISNIFKKKVFNEPKSLAAVVGEVEITQQELDNRFELLPEEYKTYVQKSDVLDQMIDEILLTDAADKEDIVVTEAEVDIRIQEILLETGLNMDSFESYLKNRSLTLEDIREFYAKEIKLTKLLDLVFSEITVSDTDIKDYYFTQSEYFTIPESINISHILICHNDSIRCESNKSKLEAFEHTNDIATELTIENFAELALKYSDEPAAEFTNGNLGWVSKDQPFDETFLNASFALEPETISEPVETVFGYHLIIVHETKEQGLVDIEVVYEQINQTLLVDLQNALFVEYIDGLRNSTEIIVY